MKISELRRWTIVNKGDHMKLVDFGVVLDSDLKVSIETNQVVCYYIYVVRLDRAQKNVCRRVM
jgi:hypothetical protein